MTKTSKVSLKKAERKLTSKEIAFRRLCHKDTGRPIPLDSIVYKKGNRHVLHVGSTQEELICHDGISQSRFVFYSGRAVPLTEQVFGKANKHSKYYVEQAGEKIPVFRKTNLAKFVLMNPNKEIVLPSTKIWLEGENTIVSSSADGKSTVCLKQKRIPKKNTMPMFHNIIEPLAPSESPRSVRRASQSFFSEAKQVTPPTPETKNQPLLLDNADILIKQEVIEETNTLISQAFFSSAEKGADVIDLTMEERILRDHFSDEELNNPQKAQDDFVVKI